MENFYKPIVSAIIATYNREKYIKRAIESVLSQTYKNIELIIVDDGSTDRTKDVIRPYLTDSNIHYIYQENKGVSYSRNKGINISRGKYIAILDSDDFWRDEKKLEKQVDFLEKNEEYVLTGGGLVKVNEDGKTLIKLLFPETDAKIRRVILFSNTFAHSTVVFKKSAWESTGGYDESFSFSEDWDLFFKFGSMGKFYNFQEYFACYLQGGQNISNLNTRKQLKFDIDLRKKYRRQYPNFRKAFFVSWFHYVFSFLLSSKQVIYISSKLKKTIIGY